MGLVFPLLTLNKYMPSALWTAGKSIYLSRFFTSDFEPFCLQLRGNEMLHMFFVIFNEGISYYLCKCIKLNTISKRGGAKFLQVMWVWYKLFTLSLGKVLQRYSVKDCFENIHKKNTYVPKGTILKLPKRCYIALGLYVDSPQCMCKKSINGNFVHCTRYLDLIDFTCFFYKQLGSGPNPQRCLYF